MRDAPDTFDLLAEIAAVVGFEAAMKIVAARGGTRAHFVRRPKPDHWLSLLIGHDQAKTLGEALCGLNASVELTVPMGRKKRDLDRWNLIMELLPSKSNAEIARLAGCHYKTVQRIRTGKRLTVAPALVADRRQGRLFSFS